jgi:hypothetical protein
MLNFESKFDLGLFIWSPVDRSTVELYDGNHWLRQLADDPFCPPWSRYVGWSLTQTATIPRYWKAQIVL